MSKHAIKVDDIEQERQQLIDELVADHGAHWAELYEPGSFGCHELLDRTALAADVVERYVRTHPACIQNQGWFALAQQAVVALQELYQRIGAAHLDAK
jgi:hypothetical protein